MGIKALPTKRGDLYWPLRLNQYIMDYGASPLALPQEGLVVASGIDGRYRGAVRRFLGCEELVNNTKMPTIPTDATFDAMVDLHTFFVTTADQERISGYILHWYNQTTGQGNLSFIYYLYSTGLWATETFTNTITTVEGVTRNIATNTSHHRVCSWRNFVYILSKQGTSQLVGWYQATAPAGWKFGVFGQSVPAGAITMATNAGPSGAGTYRSMQGRVLVKSQLRDTFRLRRSGYSTELDVDFAGTKEQRVEVKATLAHATYKEYIKDSNTGVGGIKYGYDQIEIYATENTEDKDKAPGGYYFLMDTSGIRDNYAGAQQELERIWLYSNSYVNNEAAAIGTSSEYNTSDLNLITSRFIDKTLDTPGTLGYCYALHDYQDVTFVLSVDNGQSVLRWSIPHRVEKESFPDINALYTGSTPGTPAQFVESLDYCWLFTDTTYWRLRKVNTGQGVLLETVKFGDDINIVSTAGAEAVNNTIFIVTDKGVIEFDGSRGSHVYVEGLSRLITERWANYLTQVQVCYDQRLDCVFILNPTFEEMACLWLKSGRITLMTGCPFRFARTIRVDGKRRASFMLRHRPGMTKQTIVMPRLSRRNTANIAQPLTMTGLNKFGLYNVVVTASDQGNPGLPYVEFHDVGGSYTSADQNGFLIYCTGGVAKGFVYACLAGLRLGTGDGNTVRLSIQLVGNYLMDWNVNQLGYKYPAPGDILALSPVPVDVIGGPLAGTDQETPELTTKKNVETMQASLRGIRGEYQPGGDIITFGMATLDELHDEPTLVHDSANDYTSPRRWENSEGSVGFQSADITAVDSGLVRSPINKAGYDLFPVFRCHVSNMDFQLHELIAEGKIPVRGTVKSPV